MEADVKGKVESTSNKEAAKLVGTVVAQKALAKGIESVVFDRGGFLYHGRIQELADGAREAGLQF
jgi:large subunit ribosomal protein L18